ncbi:MAG: PEP-CTERM sorting domain-containing protein [Kiritimatiellae bacterium]|nr:PEP-CTERM sorting domain-containing protein [Kiritimatiellia bacterium]
MKKFLTIAAVALVAMSVQAAQINWGINGQVKFNGTAVGNGGATFTLVCLDGIADWAAYANDVALGATDGVAATKSTNNLSMSAATSSPYGFDWADTTDISAGKIAKGTDFAFVVTYNDGTDTYFWASDVFTVTDSSANWDSTALKYTQNVAVANAMGTTGSNWTKATAVPEPASAMLALAGVAMLIRRRK